MSEINLIKIRQALISVRVSLKTLPAVTININDNKNISSNNYNNNNNNTNNYNENNKDSIQHLLR